MLTLTACLTLAFLRGAFLRLPRWPLLFLFLLCLVGCRSHPPYSDAELAAVAPFVASVSSATRAEVAAMCKDPWAIGCSVPALGLIVLADDLPPDQHACALRHELSHVYDVHIRGLRPSQTASHKGWRSTVC